MGISETKQTGITHHFEKKIYYLVVIFFLLVFIVLDIGVLLSNSSVQSEDAHLANGIYFWSNLEPDFFRVNPPLVRVWSTMYFVPCYGVKKWDNVTTNYHIRNEFPMGVEFCNKNRERFFLYLTIARVLCLVFGIVLILCLYYWAKNIYGFASIVFVLVITIFSPTILGNASTIMPDAHAAAMGMLSVFLFWKWLKRPDSLEMLLAGLCLGLAELCKFTLLIFYPLFFIMWLLYQFQFPYHQHSNQESKNSLFYENTKKIVTVVSNNTASFSVQFKQLCGVFLISIFIINCGYLFDGTFTLIKDFRFQTALFTGYDSFEEVPLGGANRFNDSGSWFETIVGYIPMPLPFNFVQGIDTQRLDFERGLPSYLRGEWLDHGWWYYYLYALLIKMPMGTIGLFFLAIFCTFFQKGYNASWRDEMVIILPGIVLLFFVSSQMGFSVHSRYIIPALPFLFLWVSKVGRSFILKRPFIATLAFTLLAWSVISSMCIYPHSISYFNELVAILPTPSEPRSPKEPEGTSFIVALLSSGPRNGGRHLLDSNIDWGQDIFNLERWYYEHPEAVNMKIVYWGSYPIELTKLPFNEKPPVNAPLPGWHALSVNYIYSRERQYRYFLNFEPIATAGYSIYIYHITLDEANAVRIKMGLPKIE
jgi:hypothetical protein